MAMTEDAVLIAQNPQEAGGKDRKKTSLVRSVFNLTKSAIGLGALFLPGNMKRMGLLGGALMLSLGALTCTLSLHLLARLAHHTASADYFAISDRAVGKRHAVAVAIALLLFQVGGLIAYVAFAGQFVSDALQMWVADGARNKWYTSYRLWSIVAAIGVMLPLSCMHDMRRIANASVAGMMAVLYIFLLTVVDYFVAVGRGTAAPANSLVLFRIGSDFLNAFSSILFAYVNHFTLVSLIPTFQKPTPRRRTALISISSVLVTAVYFGTALCGYLHYGNAVTPDILSASTTLPYGIGRLAMSLVLQASYPLQCDPTRTCCDQLLLAALPAESKIRAFPRTRHYLWTIALVGLPAIIAVTLRAYVMPILEVFSSACGSLLVFILPPFYFLRLMKNGDATSAAVGGKAAKVHNWERLASYFNMAFGVVVLLGGTVGAIIDMIKQLKRL